MTLSQPFIEVGTKPYHLTVFGLQRLRNPEAHAPPGIHSDQREQEASSPQNDERYILSSEPPRASPPPLRNPKPYKS